MQLYAVYFIPLLGSLYMFRVFYTPIIRSKSSYFAGFKINHRHFVVMLKES